MRPFKLLKLFTLFTLRTIRYALCSILFFLFFPSQTFAAPQQSDYCYLPPFVTDPNTTPNVIFVYEKGNEIKKRAYRDQDADGNIDNYTSTQTYAGFFDSSAQYTYNSTKGWFEKTNTSATAPTGAGTGSNANYYSGNMLNWALMSTLDISRKVLTGFGWPKSSGADGNAGEAFTYRGCFALPTGVKTTCEACADTSTPPANCQAPVSRGQVDEGVASTDLPGVTISLGGSNWTYGIRVTQASGQNETGVTIRIKLGNTAPNITGQCKATDNCYETVSSGSVLVKFGKACSNNSARVCTASSDCTSPGVCQEEVRYGIIQKYADKNQNYAYDSDAPRFGLRRWKTGAASDDRNADILCDSTSNAAICTNTDRTEVLENFMGALSKEPTTDSSTPYLDIMMKYIVQYFRGDDKGTYLYDDLDNVYTQTSYNWATDPAKNCRKTFAVFLTTGATIDDGTASNYLSSTSCSSLDATLGTEFAQNTCYAFNEDLYTTDTPKQNIRTYVVHTNFYGGAATSTIINKLTYAAETVGGGEYLSVSDPSTLQSKIEEALLNILSSSASASTVATLTTQTRESSTLTQAYFYPKRENTAIKWIGYLRLFWSDSGANLREDTKNTGWLDLKKDNILSFYYDPTLVAYRGRTFAVKDETPYLTIDTCDPSNAKVTTKRNDNVLAIWNAQDRLVDRSPSETDADKRNITVGLGDTSTADGKAGFVTAAIAASCTGSGTVADPYKGYCDFTTVTTPLQTTLQPFWNYASTCSSGDTTRWCADDVDDCNYCSDSSKLSSDVDNIALLGRSCSASTDCKYCELSASTVCADSTTTGGCYLPDNGTCSGTCSGSGAACTSDTGCPSGETCNGACTGNAAACTGDIQCAVNKGPCVTTNLVCTTGVSCSAECNVNNCAYQVIRYVRGYDYPKNSSAAVSSPGSSFRVRSQCTAPADCPGGTCGDKKCRSTGVDCTSVACAETDDICVGTCSSASSDVTETLKLGDIVYSTPRIAPNSAVSGYDVTYGDTSYGNFTASATVTDATPIVIVGANDGMVHAFQVSKIRDVSPPSLNCEGQGASCNDKGAVNDGHQTARFSDATTDTIPDTDCSSGGCIGKELWAYIPYNAVPYLRWYCDESYCHIPMVDARFAVIDASIDYNKDEAVSVTGGDSDALAPQARVCDAVDNCVWRRLLIGAMGIGGRQLTLGSGSNAKTWSSSVFVLDITDPTTPVLLWERPLPDNTLTSGTPALVRLSSKTPGSDPALDTENGRWYLVFGSGPTAVGTNTVSYKASDANIYVFDLRNGNLEATLPIETGVAQGVAVGDMTAVDFDSDYQVDDVYFGTYGGTGASQTGKFYRLRIRNGSSNQTTPSTWDIEAVVNAGRPIFAASEVALDSNGNKWLYFGTGLYLSLEHVAPLAYCSVATTTVCTVDSDCPSGETCTAVSGYLEYLYAVKEPDACWQSGGASCTYSTPSSSFLDTSNISIKQAKAVEAGCFCAGQLMSTILCNSDGTCTGSCGTNKVCSNNTTQSCSLDSQCPTGAAGLCVDNLVVLKVNNATLCESGTCTAGGATGCRGKIDTDAISCMESKINASDGCSGAACKGWRRAITGQKSFSRPFVAGGLVDFTSYQPTTTVCSLGGNAHLISLHFTSGTAYVQPTIFSSGATGGATTSLEIKSSVNLGTGVPPLGESLVALPLAGDTYKVITQVSGGLPGTSMAPSLPAKGGYVLWIVK